MIWLHTEVLWCNLVNVSFLQCSQYGVTRVLARISPVGIPLIRSVVGYRKIDGGRVGTVLDSNYVGTDVAP